VAKLTDNIERPDYWDSMPDDDFDHWLECWEKGEQDERRFEEVTLPGQLSVTRNNGWFTIEDPTEYGISAYGQHCDPVIALKEHLPHFTHEHVIDALHQAAEAIAWPSDANIKKVFSEHPQEQKEAT